MAGRRWKESVSQAAELSELTSTATPIVVLGGPANSYTHYIATEEEYGIQRYEGASTLYGPHTLNAYIDLTLKYLPHLAGKLAPPKAGPSPPININNSLSFITGVAFDRAPFFKSFGDVLDDVGPSHARGSSVSATFVGANPRNDLRLESTYAVVEKLVGSGIWTTVRDDADWSLIFRWKRVNSVLATSEVTITWEVEEDSEDGLYRLRYFGAAKAPISGTIEAFQGVSRIFSIN